MGPKRVARALPPLTQPHQTHYLAIPESSATANSAATSNLQHSASDREIQRRGQTQSHQLKSIQSDGDEEGKSDKCMLDEQARSSQDQSRRGEEVPRGGGSHTRSPRSAALKSAEAPSNDTRRQPPLNRTGRACTSYVCRSIFLVVILAAACILYLSLIKWLDTLPVSVVRSVYRDYDTAQSALPEARQVIYRSNLLSRNDAVAQVDAILSKKNSGPNTELVGLQYDLTKFAQRTKTSIMVLSAELETEFTLLSSSVASVKADLQRSIKRTSRLLSSLESIQRVVLAEQSELQRQRNKQSADSRKANFCFAASFSYKGSNDTLAETKRREGEAAEALDILKSLHSHCLLQSSRDEEVLRVLDVIEGKLAVGSYSGAHGAQVLEQEFFHVFIPWLERPEDWAQFQAWYQKGAAYQSSILRVAARAQPLHKHVLTLWLL